MQKGIGQTLPYIIASLVTTLIWTLPILFTGSDLNSDLDLTFYANIMILLFIIIFIPTTTILFFIKLILKTPKAVSGQHYFLSTILVCSLWLTVFNFHELIQNKTIANGPNLVLHIKVVCFMILAALGGSYTFEKLKHR